jgi:hypothetical protein
MPPARAGQHALAAPRARAAGRASAAARAMTRIIPEGFA